MPKHGPTPDAQNALQEVVGYLNFSAGAPDAKFLRSLNELFREIESQDPRPDDPADVLCQWLRAKLDELHLRETAFAEVEQARAVVSLVFDALRDEYRRHHRVLLFHQKDDELWRPFLLGRMCEAVLSQGPDWSEQQRIVRGAMSQLNDYIGYRPVAVLETEQKVEPYEPEWVRPIPLYVAEVGVATGRYEPLIQKALEVLEATDPDLLARAWFSLDALRELALDPRAYDFNHPVNKRPNYHFGQWDPHAIDNRGGYHRFVVQQVTLNALLARVEATSDRPRDELLAEAATVLAGTMLMASGTSGSGPDTHGSTTTLSTLLPHIAAYRDDFYTQYLAQIDGALGERLRREAEKLQQPLGAARQHLNQELARRRATQLQQVHLARLFARMGFPDAAMRQAQTVRVPSARMLCEIYCRLTLGHRALDDGQLKPVATYLPEVEDLLHRAIECGALVDPWNIIGFGGNFSLFPALENSIRDYRVDTLIELMEQIFALCSRAWSEAAARDEEKWEKRFASAFARLAGWWDQFATSTVESVHRLVGKELEISTNLVAGALSAWHKSDAAAGDIAFWRMFVDQFDSAKAFQLVVEALLDKEDHVASMALLMQWISQAPRIPLEDGDSSFHRLAVRWVRDMVRASEAAGDGNEPTWPLVQKFFDYLEANAEEFWQVPQLDLAGAGESNSREPEEEEPLDDGESDDDDSQLFSAAYEEMTYRDSTDDGISGDVLDSGSHASTDYELEQEARRLVRRLAFLSTLAEVWKLTAIGWGAGQAATDAQRETFGRWWRRAEANYAGLLELLDAVQHFRLPTPSGDHDSLVEYDRRRMIREGLLERIIATCVDTADAQRFLAATSHRPGDEGIDDDVARILQAILAGDAPAVRAIWSELLEGLSSQPILYVPLSKGGLPSEIVAARNTQQTLHDLLSLLPRLGLIVETCALMQTAQTMESRHAVGAGAVTEFDRLFETGYRAMVESLAASAKAWRQEAGSNVNSAREADNQLVECLQQLTESQLRDWLRHSRTLRLSVVEKVDGDEEWQDFVSFVKSYGHDLFTQKFLNLGNLRAILHQGVDAWLARRQEESDPADSLHLLEALEDGLPRAKAVKNLSLVLEAVVENYAEYCDYNSTTTSSDRGEQLYTLVDYLRLRAEYDRVAWNLRPIVLAHEVLVRDGHNEAAELWRRALVERTGEVADKHVARVAALYEAYGVQLPTISARIHERFVQPLAIDRVRALILPAMDEASLGDDSTAFSLLSQEIDHLGHEPRGGGLDLPPWLSALEEEVTLVRERQQKHAGGSAEIERRIPQTLLTREEIQRQLDAISAAN